MARIEVIQYDQAEGRLKEIYDEIISKRKQLAEVHKIQSLRPESIVKHMELYMEIMFTRSDLSRAEREMIAVVVSVCNECTYCMTHHGEALNNYWKDEEKLANFKNDFSSVGLNPRELSLCAFAKELTLRPGKHEEMDYTRELKNQGITESGVLDAVLVVAYFNFVNRIVLSLNIELEESAGKGYDY